MPRFGLHLVVRGDEHDSAALIDLDVELGKEVGSTENRHADVAEAGMKLQFTISNPCLHGGGGKPMKGKAVAGIHGHLGAVPQVESEGNRVLARHDSPAGPTVRKHRHRKKGSRRKFDFRIYGRIQPLTLA